MKFKFSKLNFSVENGKIGLTIDESLPFVPFSEVQVAGENKDSHCGAKLIYSSESKKMVFTEKQFVGDTLLVRQRSDKVEVVTEFGCAGENAVRVASEIRNVSDEEIVLEEAPVIVLGGIAPADRSGEVYLTRFFQSHHRECQPKRLSLADSGYVFQKSCGQLRIGKENVGSWSSKEELPQGIIEYGGKFIAFQIESNSSWYYEISDEQESIYLCLGGACYPFGGWCKKLAAGEKYRTPAVCLCFSDSLDGVIGELTKYRRLIAGHCAADEDMPVIFNEYMHLSWDNPDEERTKRIVPGVAEAGAHYYVIDCGWSNEEPSNVIYSYVGQWKESKTRFPHGLKKTADYIKSFGMKMGLWIEPEVIGYKCSEMLDYYDDDCFILRHGKKVCVMNRYFLDFRNEKVRSYLTFAIGRMVNEYGAEYIKLDYNQDMGVGTELNADSAGEGLEQCAAAYLRWIDELRESFPNVLFESCSSGGMRMDYATLSHFSIASTSDQVDYKKYPFIAANINSAVLPEQAAVWSYPVGNDFVSWGCFEPSAEWVEENISEEQVIFNFVNAFLGRIHLAGHVELLSEKKKALVREGVDYYNSLSLIKKESLPVFPLGFANFSCLYVCSGLKHNAKLYLAVWSTGGGEEVRIPMSEKYRRATCAYPKNNQLAFSLDDSSLTVRFTEKYQARFFELEK